MPETLVEVKGLKKYFPVKGLIRVSGHVRAVDGIDLTIGERETVGLVGESGCGKTTAGRVILRLLEPTAGHVLFRGKDIFRLSGEELKQFRREAQIILQDPYTSLNPRMNIYELITEPLHVHGIPFDNPEEFVVDALESVGLERAHVYRYPHEFSGGQRQRIAILRVLVLKPSFIVLDEPTSALDVSVQAQILNILKELQEKMGMSYLFISHDLGTVKHMSHRIAVMYLGEIVEIAPAEVLFERTLHPYSQALLSAIPIPDPGVARKRSRLTIKGEPPSPISPPSGCRFHPRCPYIFDRCSSEEPKLIKVEPDHYVSCFLHGKR